MSDLNYWDAGDDLTRGRLSPWLLLSGVFVAALLCLNTPVAEQVCV